MPTTNDIRNYLLDNSPWVDRNNTVDTVKVGDPDRPVRKAGVAWYPSIHDLRAAAAAGCDLLVVHEPLFWNHWDRDPGLRATPAGVEKDRVLSESGLVVLRAHDSWDNWPDVGIRDAWARHLELGPRVREGSSVRWHAVYEYEPAPLREFARHVADRIAPLGEDSVQVIGDPERVVSRPAVGVGCGVPGLEMVQFGADVLVMCYDGASYWSTREQMVEAGAAVVTVEHGTSEIPGIRALRDHLADVYPDVEFAWFSEHPRTWTVRGAGA